MELRAFLTGQWRSPTAITKSYKDFNIFIVYSDLFLHFGEDICQFFFPITNGRQWGDLGTNILQEPTSTHFRNFPPGFFLSALKSVWLAILAIGCRTPGSSTRLRTSSCR